MAFGIPDTVLTAIGGAFAGQGLRIIYNRWYLKRRRVQEWYEQSISLASHGRIICISAQRRSNVDFGCLADEAKRLSERLNKHVNPHPSAVDEDAVKNIKGLSQTFSQIHTAARTSDENTPLESIEELTKIASQQSKRKGDTDMGDVFEESAKRSPTMGSIFGEFDESPRTFGKKYRSQLEGTDSIHELLTAMKAELNISDERFVDELDEIFTSQEWDESLSVAVKVSLELATDLSVETINHISHVSNQEAADAHN